MFDNWSKLGFLSNKTFKSENILYVIVQYMYTRGSMKVSMSMRYPLYMDFR